MRSMGQVMGRQRVGVALVFALVLAGLFTVGHATTAPPDVAVSISGTAFHGPNGDGTFTIPVGTRVTWTNNDPFTHTTTSDATPTPVWDSGFMSSGTTFSFTFNQVGVFPYHCVIHALFQSMHGTITVIPPPSPTAVSPSAGTVAGGTNVTITGANFQNGATVTIGGAAATNVTVMNANTITATTPAHTVGTVDIVVTNPDTTVGTLTSGFAFIPLPAPKPSGPSIPGPGLLPAGRPPGNAPVSGAGVSPSVATAPAPAPLPLPPRR
jgi:plastocyanin